MSTFVVGDVLGGKYEIKAVLGAGGMGTVYRARQIDLGRDVAIKVPMASALEIPGFLARFSREAKLVAKLVHDNIVQVYEYQESADSVYIVMEYVEGQDMKSLISKPPPDMTVKDIAILLRASCEGLNHAHEFGIVHRDIKPHNIMVEQRARGKWRVKIMDFGIAHMDANSNMTLQQEQLTVTGQAIGTPSYMSPEQIRGVGVSSKSDIYSFGCVAFYAFTRQTPFQGTGFTVAASHLSDMPPPIRSKCPGLPPELEAIINRCLEKDPALRPDNASDLGNELFEALKPIFDVPMDDLWPRPEQDGGGTDIIRPTAPLNGERPAGTASMSAPTMMDGGAEGLTAGGTIAPKDHQRIPAPAVPARPMGKRDATRTGPTATNQASLNEPTIPYAGGSAAGAPMPTTTREFEIKQKRGMGGLLAVILIPVFIAAVTLGIVVKNRMGKSTSPGTGQQVANASPTPNTAAMPLKPTPTPVGATAAPATMVVTPAVTKPATPSPDPTPTEDPTVARIATLREFFKNGKSINDKVKNWQEAMAASTGKGDKFELLADEFAKDIATHPEMVELGGATYQMGSSDSNAPAEQKPPHNVRLSKYGIGRYEVTALELATYLNDIGTEKAKAIYKPRSKNPNILFDEKEGRYVPAEGRAAHPANYVSWNVASAYADWLSSQTKIKYRLPTEAEWENAAKSSQSSLYPWGGNNPTPNQAQYNSLASVGVTEMSNGTTQQGVSHMAGNVAEWCSDWYSENAYENHEGENPTGPPNGGDKPRKVLRGGGYLSTDVADIRTTSRNRLEPAKEYEDSGFRLAK
ncbi:hypothetical protein BH09SUM1_BH09SUM1_12780 [soil metagenome]